VGQQKSWASHQVAFGQWANQSSEQANKPATEINNTKISFFIILPLLFYTALLFQYFATISSLTTTEKLAVRARQKPQ
jgi:hypothetical protein